MKTRWKKLHLILATLSVVFILPTALTLAQGNGNGNGGGGGGSGGGGAEYMIIPFSPPQVSTARSIVTDINDNGQAVGVADLESGGSIAVHYDVDTLKYTMLQYGTGASGVNDLNQTVGGGTDNGFDVALFWNSPDAEPVVIPPLSGHTESFCNAINDLGLIVGYSYNDTSSGLVGRGFVCRATTDALGNVTVSGPIPLLPISGDSISVGDDVSEFVNGVALISGDSADNPYGNYNAVTWAIGIDGNDVLESPGLPDPLGTLGLNNPSESNAYAINNLGTVCGMSDNQPYVAIPGIPMEALPLTRDADVGPHMAMGINDSGVVVGYVDIHHPAWDPIHNPHAVIWKDGEVKLLEKQISKQAGWSSLWAAHVINNSGVIGGRGYHNDDVNSRGFLMFPNP